MIDTTTAILLAVIIAIQSGVIIWMGASFERERREVAAERRDLLLRIQAPQVAAAMDYNDHAAENPLAVDVTDGPTGDESYWLSREELAEKMAEEERV